MKEANVMKAFGSNWGESDGYINSHEMFYAAFHIFFIITILFEMFNVKNRSIIE